MRASNAIEIACLVFFGAEYALRFYAAGCDQRYVGWWGRLKFATTGYAMIDILSVLPSLYAIYATSSVYATSSLRGLRLLRLFKAERLMNSFFIFWEVVRDNRQIFVVLLVRDSPPAPATLRIFVLVLLLTSTSICSFVFLYRDILSAQFHSPPFVLRLHSRARASVYYDARLDAVLDVNVSQRVHKS